ncbi:MAG: flagellar FlbD family protein [Fibrobacterota bacterium]
MVKVTRINGTQLVINAELVELIEFTPDTIVTLTTGKKVILKDNVDDLIRRIVEYKRTVLERLTVVDKSIKTEA